MQPQHVSRISAVASALRDLQRAEREMLFESRASIQDHLRQAAEQLDSALQATSQAGKEKLEFALDQIRATERLHVRGDLEGARRLCGMVNDALIGVLNEWARERRE